MYCIQRQMYLLLAFVDSGHYFQLTSPIGRSSLYYSCVEGHLFLKIQIGSGVNL